MLLGGSLISPPVVSCQASHFLLLTLEVQVAHVLKKPLSLFFSERRRPLAIVSYGHVTVLGLFERKSEVC
ncbi:hypothetical protein [Ruegeria meonggei]|uniref:hypothetical protein n=1 Tax=Ruegeria meonggei TaxID=1446476 RepID=UPI00366A8422